MVCYIYRLHLTLQVKKGSDFEGAMMQKVFQHTWTSSARIRIIQQAENSVSLQLPAGTARMAKLPIPVEGAMLAGDIFHLLANVSGLASNERKIGQLVAPWILVENVKVIGK
ncbi:MAG: metallopeptidase TldD-related protein [Candidatus Bathyarchaeia archaeon]|jgi:hypothetical protein